MSISYKAKYTSLLEQHTKATGVIIALVEQNQALQQRFQEAMQSAQETINELKEQLATKKQSDLQSAVKALEKKTTSQKQ